MLCILSWFLMGILWPALSWGAVSWDTSTSHDNAGGDATDSFSHTIGTGSNVYVGVCVFMNGTDGAGSIDVSSLTINGSAANFRASADTVSDGSTLKAEYWDLVLGSTTGAVTIAPTVSANDPFRTVAFSMFGVDQTTPVGTAHTSHPLGTSSSGTVSAAVDDMVVSCLEVNLASSGWTVGAGETQRWLNSTNTNGTADQGSTEPGAASVTMSNSWTTTQYSAFIAVPVKAATAVACGARSLLGVGC